MKPMTFHHSQETSGKYTATSRLASSPPTNPTSALVWDTRYISIADAMRASNGPLTMDPTLFTASKTVGAMFST